MRVKARAQARCHRRRAERSNGTTVNRESTGRPSKLSDTGGTIDKALSPEREREEGVGANHGARGDHESSPGPVSTKRPSSRPFVARRVWAAELAEQVGGLRLSPRALIPGLHFHR